MSGHDRQPGNAPPADIAAFSDEALTSDTDAVVPIDSHLVSRLIEDQFPEWSDLAIEAVRPGGHDNRIFRLGPQMLIRLPSAGAYIAQVEKEHRWLPQLAPGLSLPIPVPLRMGRPTTRFSHPWSVYGWLDGCPLAQAEHVEPTALVEDLAAFLREFWRLDASKGPAAGEHNFYRGGKLHVYDPETRHAMATLASEIDEPAATAVWDGALMSSWEQGPVWVHGDVAAGNLLVRDGRLSAVIDFGCLGVGDPACDLVMARTYFDAPCRERFRLATGVDPATWQRARGWALWKALITLSGCHDEDAKGVATQRSIIATLLGSIEG